MPTPTFTPVERRGGDQERAVEHGMNGGIIRITPKRGEIPQSGLQTCAITNDADMLAHRLP